MITLNLPPKQVNAMLVAMDAEIAAMLMAYYTTRCKFEEKQDD